MRYQSPKHEFLRGQAEEQDHFDGLVRIDRTEYKPTKIGQRLHASLARTRINRGGLGSGKTRSMGEHLNAMCLAYPKGRVLIGRKDLTSLKETTQKEFLEKVVAPETVAAFNVNDNKLYYKNGSEVLFRETKEPDKVKSLELMAYGLDETDENESDEIWQKLDDRLRQKIWMDGKWITPPFAGILTFNPTHEEHWLYSLAQRKDISVEDFQSSTYDNIDNLPPDYIPNLLKKLPPWDVQRLVFGNWGRSVKGKPVYHGFTYEDHVKHLPVNPRWPILRGWDFGFNHPAVKWMQMDPVSGRCLFLREFLGHNLYLPQVVDAVETITANLVGPTYPIFDFGDPHGADKKDNAESSIETLRIKHDIHVAYRRSKIVTGMDEIQHKIITRAPFKLNPEDTSEDETQAPLWLVDPSCKVMIAAYMGGYHRDETGLAVKDGYYDHGCDVDRYIVVNNMHGHLASAHRTRAQKYKPRNAITGY
jgi:hypothetical protein